MKQPEIFVSQSLDRLAARLRMRLQSESFSRQVVVVPSPQVKDYLLWQFSDAAGFKFYSVSDAIDLILRIMGKYPHFPSSALLGLHVESELKKLPFLEGYIKGNKNRLRHLADHLSQLFLRYNKQSVEKLEQWRESGYWQAELYRRIFEKWDEPAPYLARVAFPKKAPIDLTLHLFALDYLTPAQRLFFDKAATIFPIYYDFFSPTEGYWGDVDKRDSYALDEQNPLVAHFGRLGQELFNHFCDQDFPLEEGYSEPSGATLLAQVQRDILYFQKGSYPEKDESIQLHLAPTLLREVEVLQMVLMNIMADDPSLHPSDILVMAPDISRYLPQIKLVFEREESPFAFEVSDLPLLLRSQSLQAFDHILSMAKEPLTPDLITKLLSFAPVKKRLDFSEEDILSFEKWMRDIHWGFDKGDRDGCFEKSHRGTFKEAFDDLLLGLATADPEKEVVDLTAAPLLGRFMTLIRDLHKRLSILKEERTLSDWADILEEIAFTYIGEEATLKATFEMLRASFLTSVFDFASVKGIFDRVLARKSASLRSGNRESVHFCSLKAGRAHPARVIYLMGMQEGSFPGADDPSSFNPFTQAPTLTDEDRYLFLEILCQAKDYLIFSAVDLCLKDGKPIAPSLLIQELFSYLEEKGELTTTHPAFGFHQSYYAKESVFDNFSPSDYEKAQHVYLGAPPPAPPKAVPNPISHQSVIDIKQLQKLARHPVQFFVNEALGVYLPFDEKRGEREFILSALEKSRLKKAALFKEPSKKSLPLGFFETVADFRLKTDIEEQERVLKKCGVEELFSLELSPDADQLETLSPTLWRLPAPRFSLPEEVMIVGRIAPLSHEGLIVFGENKPIDRAKIWPIYLLLNHLNLPIKKQLIFLKSGETAAPDVESDEMISYLRYYQEARRKLSLKMPEWTEAFESGDPEALQRAIERSLKKNLFPDPYLNWMSNSLTAS